MSNVLSCYWKVFINGNELDEARRKCVEDVDMQENCDYSDTCTLKIHDPDFLFIEDNIFIEDSTVSIEVGWNGDTHRVKFDGYISAIDIDFPDNGHPLLSVFCLDKSHIMNKKKKKRSWDNVTRAEVIQKIAKEYGFKCVIETGYTFLKEDTISQSDVTDIEFCENLAQEERVPFMCKLMDDTLYFVKKGLLQEPTSTLYYNKYPYDVVSFSPRINKETIKEEVTSSNVSTTSKSIDTHTATSSNTSRDVQGEPINTKSTVTYSPTTGEWTTNN